MESIQHIETQCDSFIIRNARAIVWSTCAAMILTGNLVLFANIIDMLRHAQNLEIIFGDKEAIPCDLATGRTSQRIALSTLATINNEARQRPHTLNGLMVTLILVHQLWLGP